MSNIRQWPLQLAVALTAAAVVADAADALRYGARPGGSKVAIEGTSSIHDWVTEGKVIGGFFEVEPSFKTDLTLKSVKSLASGTGAPKVEVFIPITSLKSTVLAGRQRMDEVMCEAMRAKDHPRITYRITRMIVKGAVHESGTPVRFDTKGELQVSGVTNVIDMEVVMNRLEGDRLKFAGAKALKMTDFKIAPPAPKLAMGLIKTGDDVTIKFEWVVGLK